MIVLRGGELWVHREVQQPDGSARGTFVVNLGAARSIRCERGHRGITPDWLPGWREPVDHGYVFEGAQALDWMWRAVRHFRGLREQNGRPACEAAPSMALYTAPHMLYAFNECVLGWSFQPFALGIPAPFTRIVAQPCLPDTFAVATARAHDGRVLAYFASSVPHTATAPALAEMRERGGESAVFAGQIEQWLANSKV